MSSPQNACEVWIDTTELREKKRKRQTRPIAKLLNPFARCGGYSVAVALNFTQTKLAMPATKQSTISSFFSTRCKDADNKPMLCPGPCVNASDTGPIKSEEGQSTDFECHTSKKSSESDISDMTGVRDFGEQSVHVLEKDLHNYSCNLDKVQTFQHLIRGYVSEDDVEEPEEKRRLSVPCSFPNSADKLALVQCLPIPEPSLHLNHLEHNTQDSQCLKALHSAREDFSVSQMSERHFRAHLPLGVHTSTQRKRLPALRSPTKHYGKENCPSSIALPIKQKDLGWSRSPRKMKPPSPSSPAAKSRPWETKCQSPQRQVLQGAQKEFETDSMASLFTQDSQGFRVIAHRNHQSWSPLKDRTNEVGPAGGWEVSVGAPDGDSDQELEAEMLFTQDSQGDLVIKH